MSIQLKSIFADAVRTVQKNGCFDWALHSLKRLFGHKTVAGIFVCLAALKNHKQMINWDKFFLNHQIKMSVSKTDAGINSKLHCKLIWNKCYPNFHLNFTHYTMVDLHNYTGHTLTTWPMIVRVAATVGRYKFTFLLHTRPLPTAS